MRLLMFNTSLLNWPSLGRMLSCSTLSQYIHEKTLKASSISISLPVFLPSWVALTPLCTPSVLGRKIPDELKFKIYLSALTQLNLDDHNRIPTSDNRLIRRIVRDYQFRGKSAAGTIAMWPSVRNGEEQHIFPFQNNADAILNTALYYELSVLKVYADPLLRCVKPTEPEYAEACQLLKFLDNFATIAPTAVPPRSIIREFIGGSAFKY